MSNFESLSHSRWDCKYHVVFIPKHRKKELYGKIRKFLGPVFHELAQQKGCTIVEGHMVSDHVHMLIKIPPKHAVSSIIGYIKGKSAIAVARPFSGRKRNFSGESFWAIMPCPRLALRRLRCASISVSKRSWRVVESRACSDWFSVWSMSCLR